MLSVIRRLRDYSNKPYPLDLSVPHSLKSILGVSLFVFLFLFLFQPFGINEGTDQSLFLIAGGYGLITFAVSALNRFLLPYIRPHFFNESRWTILHEIIDTLWHVFTIGLANTGYAALVDESCRSIGLMDVLHMTGLTLLVTVVPVVFFVGLEYNRHLKHHLKQAELMNQKIHQSSQESDGEDIVRLMSESGTDEIAVALQDLLYIKSIDNYVQVFWKQKDRIQDTLLRGSLVYVEKSVKEYQRLFRCHRSYLVNLGNVEHVEGNSQGYKLAISDIGDLIPVSRNNVKPLQKRLGLRSLKQAKQGI